MKHFKSLPAALVAALLALAFAMPAAATTYTVTSEANSGAGTLRQLIANAADGDTITFTGSPTVYLSSGITIGKKITIDGGSGNTWISASSVSNGDNAFQVNVGGVTFKNLRLVNYNSGGSMVCTGKDTRFENCIFDNCTSSGSGGAIYMDGASKVLAINCGFLNCKSNESGFGGGAIFCWSTSSSNVPTLKLVRCTFSGCSCPNSGGGAIYMCENTRFLIASCTFVGNHVGSGFMGGAIYSYDAGSSYDTSAIVNSVFAGNYSGSASNLDDIVVEGGKFRLYRSVYSKCDATGGSVNLNSNYTGTDAVRSTVLGTMTYLNSGGMTHTVYFPRRTGKAAENGVFLWHDAEWDYVTFSTTKSGTRTVTCSLPGGSSSSLSGEVADELGKDISSVTRHSMGAIEAETHYPQYEVTTLRDVSDDDGYISFREALEYARTRSTAQGVRIRFAKDCYSLAGANVIQNNGTTFPLTPSGSSYVIIDGNYEGSDPISSESYLSFSTPSTMTHSLFSITSSKAEIRNISFKGCGGSSVSLGGAISCSEAALTVTNCSFEACQAGSGGAIFVCSGSLVAQNCTFKGNCCGTSGKGAAIGTGVNSYYEGASLAIVHSTFCDHENATRVASKWNGTVALGQNATCLVGSSTFYNNKCDGIYAENTSMGKLFVVNSILIGSPSSGAFDIDVDATGFTASTYKVINSFVGKSYLASGECDNSSSQYLLDASDVLVTAPALSNRVTRCPQIGFKPKGPALRNGVQISYSHTNPWNDSFAYYSKATSGKALIGTFINDIAHTVVADQFGNRMTGGGGNNYSVGAIYEDAGLKYDVTADSSKTKGTITACWGTVPADMTIPKFSQGLAITSVGSSSQSFLNGNTFVRDLEIPDGVEKIYGFNGCPALSSVYLGKNVNDVSLAFDNCAALQSFSVAVNNPTYLSKDGMLFAYDGSYYAMVLVPPSIAKSTLETTDYPGSLSSISGKALAGNKNITKVVIPGSAGNGVMDGAFKNATALADLRFDGTSAPSSLKTTAAEGTPWLNHGGYLLNLDGTKLLKVYGKPTSLAGMPASVTEICADAFRGVTSLTTAKIPAAITKIGLGAFMNCSNLAEVTFEAENPFAVLKPGLNVASTAFNGTPWGALGGLAVNSEGVLMGCYGTVPANLVLPGHVKVIGCGYVNPNEGAFEGCATLQEITLPDSVEAIDDRAFRSSTLTKVNGGNGLQTPFCIGDEAFDGTPFLTSGADGVRTAGPVLVGYRGDPAELDLSGGAYDYITGITRRVFFMKNFTKLLLPVNTAWLDHLAIAECDHLEKLVFGDASPEMMSYAVYDCDELKTAVFPSTTEGLISGWATNCAKLDTLEIFGAGDGRIVPDAFSGQTWIRHLRLDANVEDIEHNAFSGCLNLVDIYCPDAPEFVSVEAFSDTPWYKNLRDVQMTEAILGPTSSIGACYYLEYFGGIPTVDLHLARRVNNSALDYKAEIITQVVLPPKAVEWGVEGCLNSMLFMYLDKLAEFNLEPADNYALDAQGALYTKDMKILICYPKAKTGSFHIPDSVVEVDGYAFYHAKVTSITGGENVVKVGPHSFEGCAAGNPFADRATLEFDFNDAGVTPGTSILAKVGIVFNLPQPTRPGFVFGGWEMGGAIYRSTFKPQSPALFEFKAKWVSGSAGVSDPSSPAYDPTSPAFVPPELYTTKAAEPFTGNVQYAGWVRNDDGSIKGSLSIKAAKPSKKTNTSKLTVTYTPFGGKKQAIKGLSAPVGGNPAVEVPGIGTLTLGNDSFDSSDCWIEVGQDYVKSKNKAAKAAALDRMAGREGVYVFAVSLDGNYAGFSVTVNKKGKGKLAGVLPDGTKVSVSAQGVLGEDALAIPFVFAKKASFGLVFWVYDDGSIGVSDLTQFKNAAGQVQTLSWYGISKTHELVQAPVHNAETTVGGGIVQTFTVVNRKWQFPKKGANPTGMKLSYAAKTGLVKGSFTCVEPGGRKVKYTVVGAVVNHKLVGTAYNKAAGSVPFTAE